MQTPQPADSLPIESGTTAQRRNRILFFLLLALVFAGWFAYDGWYAYPRENARKRAEGVTNLPYTRTDIFLQKVIAAGLAIVVLGGLGHLARVLRTRVVVDQAGLSYGSRRVGWEAMAGLDGSRYSQRGWVELYTSDGGRLRLDSYKIDRLESIIEAICARKGFQNPLPQPAPVDQSPQESDPPQSRSR